MKDRFLNVVKWFFIILGVLFLIQLLILSGIFIGFKKADTINIDYSADISAKEIEPLIKYIDEYKKENGKYPEKIENVKLKKGLEYKYNAKDDCYTIDLTSKKATKQYKKCEKIDDNSSYKTESFSQISK